MYRDKLSRMHKGWWVGAFSPTAFRTLLFEVGYKVHKKGSHWAAHYQKTAYEGNLLMRGRMRIGKELFKKGDIFIVFPKEVVKPVFLTDCEVMVWKAPSLPKDKVVVR